MTLTNIPIGTQQAIYHLESMLKMNYNNKVLSLNSIIVDGDVQIKVFMTKDMINFIDILTDMIYNIKIVYGFSKIM